MNERGLREEEERMVLALLRLGERDRDILQAHLKGETASQLAERYGLSHAAAEKALTRAKQRARRIIASDRVNSTTSAGRT